MSAPLPFSEALRLDAELVRLARGASALRLAVGDALGALSSSGGHHELGFSSLDAYARERCERTGRWAADTRALAERLRTLPRTRQALRTGAIGWSTAELLARHVTRESELAWLEKARNSTVRELRALLSDGADAPDDFESEPTRTLTVSATSEDGWMFECARKVAEAVAGPMPSDRLLQTLLAEGYSTLLELVPDCSELHEIDGLERDAAAESEAQAAWCAERERWRREAEVLCETRRPTVPEFASAPEFVSAPEFDGGESVDETSCVSRSSRTPETPESLDREIRRLCTELSERDLALGIVAESARKAEVWRRLGFATEAQYAHERVGVSLSSLKAKRILATRAARVPELAAALSSGRVGYEAAYLLSRVVTPKTAEEWLRRAERRTVKHLREEVEATELLIRGGQPREQPPLDEASLDALLDLERSIVGGDWVGHDRDSWAGEVAKGKTRTGGQMSEAVSPDGDTRGARQRGSQMSGAVSARSGADGRRGQRHFGRVTLRFCVTEETCRFFRALERVFAGVYTRVCRAPSSFLRFLSENFCRIWLPALREGCLTESGDLPEYFGVYRRDAFRCTSPVCRRRDLTPHHLRFRSHGGGDEDENVASLCSWCHLHGIHEGRIAAAPPASKIRWRIGRRGTLSVEGREKGASPMRAIA